MDDNYHITSGKAKKVPTKRKSVCSIFLFFGFPRQIPQQWPIGRQNALLCTTVNMGKQKGTTYFFQAFQFKTASILHTNETLLFVCKFVPSTSFLKTSRTLWKTVTKSVICLVALPSHSKIFWLYNHLTEKKKLFSLNPALVMFIKGGAECMSRICWLWLSCCDY